jgi:glutaredoxin 3
MAEVTIYTTPTCPWCKRTKDWLKANNVAFKEVDVSIDEAKARQLVERTGQVGVPVTEVDGRLILGFNADELKKALGK